MQVGVSLEPLARLVHFLLVVQLVDQRKQRRILLFTGEDLATIIIMLFAGRYDIAAGGSNSEQHTFGPCAHTQLKRGIHAVIRVEVIFIDYRQAGVSPFDCRRLAASGFNRLLDLA